MVIRGKSWPGLPVASWGPLRVIEINVALALHLYESKVGGVGSKDSTQGLMGGRAQSLACDKPTITHLSAPRPFLPTGHG